MQPVNLKDNITLNEKQITSKQITSEALNGRYYSYDTHQWESLGWLEKVIRNFISCFTWAVDSAYFACLRRSWKSIEKMPEAPTDIAKSIQNLFLDSRGHTNRQIGRLSGVISRIYCNIQVQQGIASGNPLSQILIRQPSCRRVFDISEGNQIIFSVANSEWGQLDFFNTAGERAFTNDCDTLYTAAGKRMAAIRLAVDYKMTAAMKILSEADLPRIKVQDDESKEWLVFRDATTHQFLAVAANYQANDCDGLCINNWKITIFDPANLEENKILLSWAVLKHLQHYLFPSPRDVPYVERP